MERNICEIDKNFLTKSGSNAIIFQTNDNRIIKSKKYVNKNNETKYIKYIKQIQDNNIKQLFVNIVEVKQCNKYMYYLMENYDYDVNKKFLLTLNKENQKNLLLQILLGIYYLNHELKIYHNDLYHRDTIRNVMCNKIDKKIYIKYENFNIICENYLCKIIDFG